MSINVEEMRETLSPSAKRVWDQIEEVIADYIMENKSRLSLEQIDALRQRKMIEAKSANLAVSISRTKDPIKIRKMKLELKELEREYATLEKKVKNIEPELNERISQLKKQKKVNTNMKKAG